MKHGIVFFLMSLLLVACSDDRHSDLHDFIKEVAERPGRPITPIPDFRPSDSHQYPAKQKRRDPFAKKRQKNQDKVDAPDLARTKQPLEAFPLDALAYVGHLKEQDMHWALIQAPNQEVFKLAIGQYIGRNYGRVVDITPSAVVIRETVRVNGRWQKKQVMLKLR